jgi:glutathione peroxidase
LKGSEEDMRRVILILAALLGGCSSTSAEPAPSSGSPTAATPSASSADPAGATVPKKDAGAIPPTIDTGFDAGLLSACTPPAAPGEIYSFTEENLAGSQNVAMCSFRDRVMLVVNTASHCGNTPQYAPLQALYESYRAQGFVVLGFPCNQFGQQESGTAKEISDFCTQEYGITFPMFTKLEVNGPGADPLYQWLKSQPGATGDIEWNFAKFLVGRDGKLIKRYPADSNPGIEPLKSQITADIEAALAK